MMEWASEMKLCLISVPERPGERGAEDEEKGWISSEAPCHVVSVLL